MILAATGNKCQLHLVEQAMMIQFPKDEIRNHDDRTGKYNNNILASAVNVEENQLTGDMEVPDSSGDDLDVLATAQEEEEVEALTSLATISRTLREARAKQHQVRMARCFFPQQQSHPDRNNGRPERKCALCGGSHWGSQCPEKQGRTAEKKGDATGHVAHSEFAMSVHAETSMFSQEALETGKALRDCGAARSMRSSEELNGLSLMNKQLYGSPRLSLDRTRKTWYTFADGERPQSKRVVAFQENVGGKMSDWKIACLNATGVPILLTVQSLSKMGAIIDFSTGASFFRNLTDTVFAQLEQEANGHLYLSPVKDMLSQLICDEDQLLRFQAAARILGNLGKKRAGPSVYTRRRRDR